MSLLQLYSTLSSSPKNPQQVDSLWLETWIDNVLNLVPYNKDACLRLQRMKGYIERHGRADWEDVLIKFLVYSNEVLSEVNLKKPQSKIRTPDSDKSHFNKCQAMLYDMLRTLKDDSADVAQRIAMSAWHVGQLRSSKSIQGLPEMADVRKDAMAYVEGYLPGEKGLETVPFEDIVDSMESAILTVLADAGMIDQRI